MAEEPWPRTLLLLRHATAGSGADDVERPLTEPGRAEAEAVGRILAAVPVDLVLSSSSRRTRETVAALGLSCETCFEEDLYLASAETLRERIRQVQASVHVLLVVAHNPGVQGLAHALVASKAERRQLDGPYPAASLAVFTVPRPWGELRRGEAQLVALHRPR